MKYASAAYAMTSIDHHNEDNNNSKKNKKKQRKGRLQSLAATVKEQATNKLLDKIKIDDHLSKIFIVFCVVFNS